MEAADDDKHTSLLFSGDRLYWRVLIKNLTHQLTTLIFEVLQVEVGGSDKLTSLGHIDFKFYSILCHGNMSYRRKIEGKQTH